MSIWDSYENRVSVRGNTKRETFLKREQHMLYSKLPDSLSFHTAVIDGVEREVAIINSDNLNEKTIYSMTVGDFKCGSYVKWMNNYWLVTEYDANSEVYIKAKLRQCNHLLKWIDADAVVHEQWCIIEDGTKYLTGEYEDRNFVVTRGDSRIAMTIAKNEHTVKFERETRFLIDDPDVKTKLAYLLTKPLKVGWVYGNEGIYSFVLQEVVSTDDDNHDLGVADYYKHFPIDNSLNSEKKEAVINPDDIQDDEGRKVWL